MKAKHGTRAVIYCRKSSDDRKNKDASLTVKVQAAQGRALAAAQGYTLVGEEVYTDDGISGRTWAAGAAYDALADSDTETQAYIGNMRVKRRPALGRLLDTASRGQIDIIIVRDTTRLARPKMASALQNWIPSFLKSHNVIIHSQDEGIIDPHDPHKLMLRLMLDNAIDIELSRKAETSRTTIAAMRNEGIYLGKAPYGYAHTSDRVFAQIPQEAEVVCQIAKAVIEGGVLSLLTKYNKNELPNPTGRKWNACGVWRMIKNPAYCGMIRNPDGAIIDSKSFPKPILSKAIWKKCIDAQKARCHAPRQSRESIHPLSGLMYCGCCGAALSARKNNGYSIYTCNNRSVSGNPECYRSAINEVNAIQFFKPFSMIRVFKDKVINTKAIEARKKLIPLQKTLIDLKKRRLALVTDSEFDADFVKEASAELTSKINAAQNEINNISAIPDIAEIKSNTGIITDYSVMTDTQVRDALRDVIKRIVVFPRYLIVTLFDDTKIKIQRTIKASNVAYWIDKPVVIPLAKADRPHILMVSNDSSNTGVVVDKPYLLLEKSYDEGWKPIHPVRRNRWTGKANKVG